MGGEHERDIGRSSGPPGPSRAAKTRVKPVIIQSVGSHLNNAMGEQPTHQLDPVTTTRGGVAVERRLDVKASGGVVADVRITSTRETPLDVTVIDYLPGTWAVDEIGFHDGFAPRSGSTGSDSVVFEVDVTPESPARVVYGMVLDEPVEVEDVAEAQASTRPRIDKLEPADGGESAASFSDVDPAEFFEIAGSEPDSGATDADDVPGEDRDVLYELAEELAGEVDEDSLETVQRALVEPFGKSNRLRLRRLESRLEEFDVYVEALRAIIDEHGTGVAFLDDVQDSIESIGDEVDSLRAEVERAAARREDVADELSELSDLGASVEELDREVQSVDASVEGLDDELAAVRSEVDSLRERVADWEAVRDRLVDALNDQARE